MATSAAACNGQPGPPPNNSSRTRDQSQTSRQQEGYRAKPDQEQGVLLLGEQLVAVCDHFHRC
jgi:hypothetical protein